MSNSQTATARNGKAQKRYTLVLPEELFAKVQELADERGATVVDILRRFIKLGLLVAQSEDSPDSTFVIREGGSEREVILL